ncbi:MAG TPA: preprotein translocase subunit SecE [Verrucomicrobiae bacterium]|nr:preprotein translocase subunit SecE [Verrucomicrobiae bacterium]
MSSLKNIFIWVGVIAVAFVFLWKQGYLMRLSTYVQETREELKKCTWPTWNELKGSTVLVMVSIAFLGVFTVVADFVFSNLMRWISSIS